MPEYLNNPEQEHQAILELLSLSYITSADKVSILKVYKDLQKRL